MTPAARTCGECAACCTTTPVVPLKKPGGQRCKFQVGGDTPAEGHCAIYHERPHCCAVYACEWLRGLGTDDDRPDRSGVVVELARDERGHGRVRLAMLMPAPGFDEASPSFVAAVERWRAAGAVVTTPTRAHATPEQLQWLATVTFEFGDGKRIGPLHVRPHD